MSELKTIRVAVFVHSRKGRKPLIMAYTRDYNSSWEGYNGVSVEAKNGTEAKKLAIAEIKRRIDAGDPVRVY